MFALAVVLARSLGAETYGTYGLALAIALVIVPLADLGLTPYLSREVARDVGRGSGLARRVLRIKGAISLTLVVTTAAIALVFLDGTLATAVVLVTAAQLAESLAVLVYGYFQGRETMAFEARSTSLASVSRAAGGIALSVATGSLTPVLLWFLLVSAVQLAVAKRRLEAALRPVPMRGDDSVVWRTVVTMGAMAALVMLYARSDTILIGVVAGEREVGWYTAAYTLMLGLQIAPWMVALALTPVFARAYRTDPGLFDRAWQTGVLGVLLVSLPLALGPTLLAAPLVRRLYGDEFLPAADALAVLAWTVPLSALTVVIVGALRGAGREAWLLAVAAITVVVNIGANLVAVPAYGIVGAATVMVGSEALNLMVLAWLAWSRGIVRVPRFPLGRAALAGAAFSVVALALPALPVEARLALATVAYGLVLVLTRVVRRDDVARLRGQLGR